MYFTYCFLYTDSVKADLVRRALPRAAFHAALGIVIASSVYLFPRPAVLAGLTLITVAFIVMDITRLRLPTLMKRFSTWSAPFLRRQEDSRLTGASYFLIGCLVSVLAFQRDIAVLALLFLSLGDPAATIIGIWKGRVRIWNKSIEGDAACLIVCLVISILITSIVHSPALAVGIVGAFFAAILEGLPVPINDNLTIPIGSGLGMTIVGALVG